SWPQSWPVSRGKHLLQFGLHLRDALVLRHRVSFGAALRPLGSHLEYLTAKRSLGNCPPLVVPQMKVNPRKLAQPGSQVSTATNDRSCNAKGLRRRACAYTQAKLSRN